jgi:hypothetical protein
VLQYVHYILIVRHTHILSITLLSATMKYFPSILPIMNHVSHRDDFIIASSQNTSYAQPS